jgi:DNA-binding LacI/PurR family transcriptional regulator
MRAAKAAHMAGVSTATVSRVNEMPGAEWQITMQE